MIKNRSLVISLLNRAFDKTIAEVALYFFFLVVLVFSALIFGSDVDKTVLKLLNLVTMLSISALCFSFLLLVFGVYEPSLYWLLDPVAFCVAPILQILVYGVVDVQVVVISLSVSGILAGLVFFWGGNQV